MSRLIDADALIQKANYEADGMAEPFKSQFGVLVEWLVDKTPTIEPETEEEAYERGYTAGQMAQRKKGKWIDGKCDQCGVRMEEPEDIPMEYFESGGR